jgi:hypothetical protein
MTGAFRRCAALLAILATVLTAGAVGAARGQAMAAGQIVICADGGAVTLSVDAEGNPTGTPHWCPDCVLSLLAGLPSGPVTAEPRSAAADARPAACAGLRAAARPAVPPARGPPAA